MYEKHAHASLCMCIYIYFGEEAMQVYRNYRKRSEAHCGQHNQKVAAQRDIQCVFQLVYEPVNENTYNGVMEKICFTGHQISFNCVTLHCTRFPSTYKTSI